jgi:hypothetical protein
MALLRSFQGTEEAQRADCKLMQLYVKQNTSHEAQRSEERSKDANPHSQTIGWQRNSQTPDDCLHMETQQLLQAKNPLLFSQSTSLRPAMRRCARSQPIVICPTNKSCLRNGLTFTFLLSGLKRRAKRSTPAHFPSFPPFPAVTRLLVPGGRIASACFSPSGIRTAVASGKLLRDMAAEASERDTLLFEDAQSGFLQGRSGRMDWMEDRRGVWAEGAGALFMRDRAS